MATPAGHSPAEPLWTVADVARFLKLKLKPKTVYNLVERGEIPVLRVARSLRFDPDSLVRHFSGGAA